METKQVCSICGKPLTPGAPEGLCPECLLKAGLGTGVDIGADTGGKVPRFVPPKIEELTPKFPQLEILEFIGQGGMGAVYKARQKQLDRIVALKILPPQAASGAAFAERFTREARALARLNHPHIVTLYEFGQADGLFYFLMEFVDGVNLRQLLNTSRMTPREALAIVPQICEALQFAHDTGIVHRDIKPENILLDKKGQVKIADFGVAKLVTQGMDESAAEKTAPSGDLTEAGSSLGTPQYMAPEQIKNSAEVDHRADIYSLGVVFYQMLTGELPSGKIEPPSKKVVIDVRLDEVVLRALEKQPEMRFQQVSDVKTIIETIATTPQPSPQITPQSQRFTAPIVPTAPDLKKGRLKTVIWSFVLAAACVLMAANVSPATYSWTIGTWGIGLSLISIVLALLAANSLKKKAIAAIITAINGIGTASAAIWCACHSQPPLAASWLDAILLGCCGGIVYCLHCLLVWSNMLATTAAGDGSVPFEPAQGSQAQIPDRKLAFIKIPFVILRNGKPATSWPVVLAAGVFLEFLVLWCLLLRAAIGLPDVLPTQVIVVIVLPIMALIPLWLYYEIRAGHNALAQGQPPLPLLSRRKKLVHRIVGCLLTVLFIAFYLRTFVITPYRVETDSVAPEIPRGSHFLVWRLAHTFSPGDLIAYRNGNDVFIGRVSRVENNDLLVNKNGRPDISISRRLVIGTVISIYWRGTMAPTPTNVEFHYRVFEDDASLVDQLIPANQRQSGVQTNVNFYVAHESIPGAETDSQMATVPPDVLYTLLNGIAAKPGLLVDARRVVSSDYWNAGYADGWTYAATGPNLWGGGTGNALWGVQRKDGVFKVRMKCLLTHGLDTSGPGAQTNVYSKILFEGEPPQNGALVFLVPFLRYDGSAHYLVVTFNFNGNGEPLPQTATSSPPQNNEALSFGLIIERTLSVNGNESDFLIFRSGQVLRHAYVDGDANNSTPPGPFMKWARENGVDIGLCASTNAFYSSPGLLTLDMGTFQFESNAIPAAMIPRFRSVTEWQAYNAAHPDSPATRPLIGSLTDVTDVWNDLTANQLDGPTNDVPAFFLREKPFALWLGPAYLSAPIAFATHDGLEGIMQITGFTDNPRSVKIRYKLVQNADGSIRTGTFSN